MKIKANLKSITIVVFLIGVAAAIAYLIFLPEISRYKTLSESLDRSLGWKFPVTKSNLAGSGLKADAHSNLRDAGGVPQGLPVRLKIPIINVDSAIEDALITPDGKMDVPAGSVNVAWFALGPPPGQVGSSVIGGHFGIKSGIPFVF